MNLGASLSAFANDIPNAFGSAIDSKFLSTGTYKSDPDSESNDLAVGTFALKLENKGHGSLKTGETINIQNLSFDTKLVQKGVLVYKEDGTPDYILNADGTPTDKQKTTTVTINNTGLALNQINGLSIQADGTLTFNASSHDSQFIINDTNNDHNKTVLWA